MTLNKSLLYIILSSLFLFATTLSAQVRVVNENGDAIILMPDGTWKYADPKKKKDEATKVIAKKDNTVTVEAKGKSSKTKKEKKAKSKKSKTKSSKKKSKKDKSKKVKKPKTKKPKKVKKKKPKKEKKPKVKKSKSSKKKSKEAVTKKSKKASNSKDIAKKIKKSKTKTTKPSKGKKATAFVYKVPKRKRKVKEVVKPIPSCDYAMDEKDVFTQKRKVGLTTRPFFTFTQPQLKKFLRGQDYLICEGSLSKVVGVTVLNVKFTIESTQAQKEYGRIEDGTRMMIKLLNDETVNLICDKTDAGVVDTEAGTTTYDTYFTIHNKAEKELRKSEVIQVRVLWSTGYEDYEVNELDFFMDQFYCIDAAYDKKKK